jgi:hypothetical protein
MSLLGEPPGDAQPASLEEFLVTAGFSVCVGIIGLPLTFSHLCGSAIVHFWSGTTDARFLNLL